MNPTRLEIFHWAWYSCVLRLACVVAVFWSASVRELSCTILQDFDQIVLVRVMDASDTIGVMTSSRKFRACLTPFHEAEIDPGSPAAAGFDFAAR